MEDVDETRPRAPATPHSAPYVPHGCVYEMATNGWAMRTRREARGRRAGLGRGEDIRRRTAAARRRTRAHVSGFSTHGCAAAVHLRACAGAGCRYRRWREVPGSRCLPGRTSHARAHAASRKLVHGVSAPPRTSLWGLRRWHCKTRIRPSSSSSRRKAAKGVRRASAALTMTGCARDGGNVDAWTPSMTLRGLQNMLAQCETPRRRRPRLTSHARAMAAQRHEMHNARQPAVRMLSPVVFAPERR